MSENYLLEGHKPVPCEDLIKWAKEFHKLDRRVDHTEVLVEEVEGVKWVKISTVFLGIDHSFEKGPPLLFETMIFGGKYGDYEERCSTWDEAVAQHAVAVALVKSKE